MDESISFGRIDPDTGERFQRLASELGVSAFGINLMTLQPGQRGRIHTHLRQEEVFLILEGELALIAEGEERALGVGELARVAPGVRRQMLNRGPQRLVMLALGGYGEHEGNDGRAWVDWETTDSAPARQTPLPDDLPVAGA